MKSCQTCKKELPLSSFGNNKHYKDGLQRMCKSCCAERDRKHYLKNKEQYYQRAKNVWEHRRAFTLRYKKMFGKCVDCGIDDWRVLQFDHVRGKKLGVISDLYSYKMSTLKEEIRKCDFRCANCHQIKTHFS